MKALKEANTILHGDCLQRMKRLPDQSVDLVFGSPPYEDARTYGVDFKARGEAWVEWALPRYLECLRVCRGLVAWVVEGRTTDFRYSATPMLLAAELHKQGVHLRKPPIFHRVGIPGSGGPDWLRNDYEFILCATNGGRLPWSNNTAMGNGIKFATGGGSTHRKQNGKRQAGRKYAAPKSGIANPGNVIHCKVGGGHMGSELAHENEAPFPEALAEFFVRSFCPPEGIVLDPFCGSGTTLDVASQFGRQWIGFDIRESQIELSIRRMFGGGHDEDHEE